ncbi:MAG: hypothetical protein LBL43_08685 [Treponema sp.]|nr:hypothetical protein [Treponema sp.]
MKGFRFPALRNPGGGFSGGSLFLLLFPLFLAPGLAAQSPGWFLEQSGGEPRFFQRLSWSGVEDSLSYEAVVERRDEGRSDFYEVLREGTTENFILVSLPPGAYRYQVRAYSIVEKPGTPSSWVYFEIILPLKPELRTLSPRRLYLEGRDRLGFSVAGENLVKDSVFFLRPRRGEKNVLIFPEWTLDEESGRAELEFPVEDIVPGAWEVGVRNPGDLEDSLGPLRVAYADIPGFSVRGALAPFIPLPNGYLKRAYREVYQALAVSLALDLSLVKTPYTDFGLGVLSLFPSWYALSGRETGPIYIHLMGFDFYLFYQQRLPDRRFALNLRLGYGISLAAEVNTILNEGYGFIPTDFLSGGFFFRWFISESLFAEAGFDLIHLLEPGHSGLEYIRPSLGLGWNF